MSRMNEKHKNFFIGLGARAYRIQILSVNRPGQVIALGAHYRCQIFDDLIHASRERSTIRSAKRGNSGGSSTRPTQTLTPAERLRSRWFRNSPSSASDLWKLLIQRYNIP